MSSQSFLARNRLGVTLSVRAECMCRPGCSKPPGATMKIMQKFALILLGLLVFSSWAGAQEATTNEPYEFILAKLAADAGRFDEALSLLDKVVAKNPDNSVLLYERAMVLIDASKIDRAEAELRRIASTHPDFYEAQRVLGRLLLDRAAGDKAKTDEALTHLQAAFKLNPDDLSTGMAVSQLLLQQNRTAEAEKGVATLLERAPDQR